LVLRSSPSGPQDTTRPTISAVQATPASVVTGGTVTISATVTDDVQVTSVVVDMTQPDATSVNQTMVAGANNVYSHAQAWTQIGTYTFRIWATDSSGNVASAAGSFEITQPQDTTPPTVSHTPPAGPFQTGETITIEAVVTDDVQVQLVKVAYTDVAGVDHNETMTLQAGKYTFTIPGQIAAGTVVYRIYARDASGNAVITQEFTLVVEAPAWHLVASFSGSTDKTTDSFTITGSKFRVRWTAVAENEFGLFILYVYKVGQNIWTESVFVTWNAAGEKSDETVVFENGNFYLEIGAANLASWSIVVEEWR